MLRYYGASMSDVISQYQKWKEQGETLRSQAKQAMEARFRELLSEAVRIAEEYRADFGGVLKASAPVTTFRYKAPAKTKNRKAGKKAAARAPEPAPQAAPKPDTKVARLQKKLTTAKGKLEAAKTAGKPTRSLEDYVYEIEDEIRLATQQGA
jgi:hypothetical protein